MDSFKNAKVVRLRGHYDKYLTAKEDKVSVIQDGDGSAESAKWTMEHISNNRIRLKSCYGNYLTASTERFILGAAGRKVVQSLPRNLDSSVEWNPIRVGQRLKLQTESGECLRANGGVPPYLDKVTHKVPLRSPINKDYLWLVDVLETEVQKPTSEPHNGASPSAKPPGRSSTPAKPPAPTNRPGNTPGLQINPAIISTAATTISSTATAVAAIDGMMANHDKSTNETSTTMSQPEDDKKAADDEEHADRDTGVTEEGDVGNEEEVAGDAFFDEEGEIEEARDLGGAADIGSIFDIFSSVFQV